ncbi:MAG: tRNA nucleotidyltransferase [Bacteroidetes bacterium]|nr:MAG: tRNA nucleotidyltransferase [Bacteroidota bacterium]
MLFDLDKDEREVFELMRDSAMDLNYDTYVVGGYVRDRLLGIPSQDIDVVAVGSGISLAEHVASKLIPIPQVVVYQRFGTALIKHLGKDIEFVGARKESYRSDSRKPIVENGTLEDDQCRRDFTINALAVSLNPSNYGTLIDPFDGLRDLEDRIIRTPLDPGKTFSDDPLRMLRAIRFAAQLDFVIEEQTLRGISEYRNRLKIVSKERITDELNKMLVTSRPSIAFELLFDTGLLELILPEVVRLQGVDIVNGQGHKDNFYHTLEVLDNLALESKDLWLRWAALLHDIAKPATKRFEKGTGWTFHGHDALGAAMVPQMFRRLRLPLDHKMKFVQKLVQLHLRPISLTKENITDSAIRRLLFDAGDDLEDLMMLCRADITSKNANRVNRYRANYKLVEEKLKSVEETDRMRNWQPPITGEIIMETFGLRPSRQVGDIKAAIREAILDGELENEYDAAFKYMIELGNKIGLHAV